MASSSGTSSGSTLPFTSGSDGDDFKHQQQQQQAATTATTTTAAPADQRRQKRMLSNRESARRSRMRKQKHLDDLTAEVSRLRVENERLVAAYKSATRQHLALEADNSVMRAQAVELATRLQALADILGYLDDDAAAAAASGCDYAGSPRAADGGPWIWGWSGQQQPSIVGVGVGMGAAAPIPPMAADMLLY